MEIRIKAKKLTVTDNYNSQSEVIDSMSVPLEKRYMSVGGGGNPFNVFYLFGGGESESAVDCIDTDCSDSMLPGKRL